MSVDHYVNQSIKPMTDFEHWGTKEKWSYPDDGYGDCEDYVLLKRRLLIQTGWPREALLITVVRDRKDEAHAVLTVKSDCGRLPLRQAPIAEGSQRLGLARESAGAHTDAGRRARALR